MGDLRLLPWQQRAWPVLWVHPVPKGISVPKGHPALDGTLVPKRRSHPGAGDSVPQGCPVMGRDPIPKYTLS